MALFTLCFLFSSTPSLIIATTLYKPRQKYPTVLIFGHESVSAFMKFLFNAVFSSKKFSHLEHYSFFRLNTSAPSQWPFKCGRKSSILIETENFSSLLLPRSQSYHRDARGNGMGRGEQMRWISNAICLETSPPHLALLCSMCFCFVLSSFVSVRREYRDLSAETKANAEPYGGG